MMKHVFRAGTALVATFTLAVCGGTAQTPTSPSAATGGGLTAAADGSTLKVTAPALIAPIGGARVDSLRPTLTWTASTGTFASPGVTLTYDVQGRPAGRPYARPMR